MQLRSGAVVVVLFLLAASSAVAQVSIQARVLVSNGGRLSWYKGGAAHNLIAFDAGFEQGLARSEVFSIVPDGSNPTCITCGSGVPEGFVGQPAWHPNGAHLVVQAESIHSSHTFFNSVLWGFDNDLWIIRRDGTGAERIWATPQGGAALHPQFSSDGRMLMFSERVAGAGGTSNPYNNWRIVIADFDIRRPGTQKLANIRTIQPNGPGIYETHEFANNRVIYSHGSGEAELLDEIYASNLDGTGTVPLMPATPGAWDEHGHLAPTRPWIMAFMSSRFDPTPATPDSLRTELYLSLVGATPVRVTYFNRSVLDRVIVKDLDWDRTGSQIAFLVSGREGENPQIWIVSLSAGQ